jgi:hypothetical protein
MLIEIDGRDVLAGVQEVCLVDLHREVVRAVLRITVVEGVSDAIGGVDSSTFKGPLVGGGMEGGG